MPEALARMRHDHVLVGRSSAGGQKLGVWVGGAFRRLAGIRPAGFAAALMTAAMCGVVVNALFLQHERHPAPLFGAEPSRPAAPAAPTASPSAVVRAATPAPEISAPPVAAPAAPATPPARPADLAAPEAPAPTVRHGDPIGELLKGGKETKDSQRLTLAAQTALVKLGYVLKADGQAGADTMTALHEFEKAHGLAPSAEITPKVVKSLNAAMQAGR